MKRIIKLLLVFLFLAPAPGSTAFAQSGEKEFLSMDGLVYGYNYDYSKKLLKKDRQIKVEGVLENVTVTVTDDKEKLVKTAKTNSHGLFYIRIKTGKVYSLSFFREGYSGILMTVDLT